MYYTEEPAALSSAAQTDPAGKYAAVQVELADILPAELPVENSVADNPAVDNWVVGCLVVENFAEDLVAGYCCSENSVD